MHSKIKTSPELITPATGSHMGKLAPCSGSGVVFLISRRARLMAVNTRRVMRLEVRARVRIGKPRAMINTIRVRAMLARTGVQVMVFTLPVAIGLLVLPVSGGLFFGIISIINYPAFYCQYLCRQCSWR